MKLITSEKQFIAANWIDRVMQKIILSIGFILDVCKEVKTILNNSNALRLQTISS